jgi:hypothetical protein
MSKEVIFGMIIRIRTRKIPGIKEDIIPKITIYVWKVANNIDKTLQVINNLPNILDK